MGFLNRARGTPSWQSLVSARTLEDFGRTSFDPARTGVAAGNKSEPWRLLPELHAPAAADPSRFTRILADCALPIGAWTVYGASRLIWELLGSDYEDADADAVRLAALQWLRTNGVPRLMLAPLEWEAWLRLRPPNEPWARAKPDYAPETASITDLDVGESRRLAQLTQAETSNVTLARRDETGYFHVIEAPRSSDDPTRVAWDWDGPPAESVRELYIAIGERLQFMPYWCDPEFEAFVPLARPKIPVW